MLSMLGMRVIHTRPAGPQGNTWLTRPPKQTLSRHCQIHSKAQASPLRRALHQDAATYLQQPTEPGSTVREGPLRSLTGSVHAGTNRLLAAGGQPPKLQMLQHSQKQGTQWRTDDSFGLLHY